MVGISEVTRRFVVPKRVEDLKFHLSEVVNLEEISLIGSDHPCSTECNEQFFHRIEIDYPTRKARNRLYKLIVGKRRTAMPRWLAVD